MEDLLTQDELIEFMNSSKFKDKLADVINDLIFFRAVRPLPRQLTPHQESEIREVVDEHLKTGQAED